MNIVRKLRKVARSNGGARNSGVSDDNKSVVSVNTVEVDTFASKDAINMEDQANLSLMHLIKLFSEYIRPYHNLSDRDKEDKLYNMLPLFCKVFGTCSCSDIIGKFQDITIFTSHISRLMVCEIRKRASNKSTEIASLAITRYLEIENTEESSNGWMLLSSLNLLASTGNYSIIMAMTNVSLPSTLVKCLYLLFDLPELKNTDIQTEDSEFTPKERRILLQKIFIQLLVRLCAHVVPTEELAAKGDLTLLFSAVTTWCPPSNVAWRKSAAEILMTISKHGLTNDVISHIREKSCISISVDNMRKRQDLTSSEVVEMFVTVFCFLKNSTRLSHVLMDEFKSAHGYIFLSDFLLSLQNDDTPEGLEVKRNIVLTIASLSTCGFSELRPNEKNISTALQMSSFYLPQPTSRGSSVRNIDAFNVLQSVFMTSNCATLCNCILDAISGVFNADIANYFIILDQRENKLPEFCGIIHLKTQDIQEKYFTLMEFIVFRLNFIPCNELVAMSLLLKNNVCSTSCVISCLRSLLSILRYNQALKDVFREIGLLEILSRILQQNALTFLEQHGNRNSNFYCTHIVTFTGNNDNNGSDNSQVTSLLSEIIAFLLRGNSSNGNLFRECGYAKTIHEFVQCTKFRQHSLAILRELMLSNSGEDDMSNILALLHSASSSSLDLKIDILKCLIGCLKESHRARSAFRKVGGFVYITSALVSMEDYLSAIPPDTMKYYTPQQVLHAIYHIFAAISVAMRFEPANAKYFYQHICSTSFCDMLKLLGCFTESRQLEMYHNAGTYKFEKENNPFHSLFVGNISQPCIPSTDEIPKRLSYACLIMRMLYDLVLDAYENRDNNVLLNISFQSPLPRKSHGKVKDGVDSNCNLPRTNSLDLKPPIADVMIVHAPVAIVMLHLLPSLGHYEDIPGSIKLKLYMANILKSLVYSERNQQIMCEADFLKCVFQIGKIALEKENHLLYFPLMYIVERLATQYLKPIDLRLFLRLGDPLCCKNMDEEEDIRNSVYMTGVDDESGGCIALSRVKTFVSMATPRHYASSNPVLAVVPSFVEMDMSIEGFGCLFLPSIAPQFSTISVGAAMTAEYNLAGGIGYRDRLFPPQVGFSYSTWICVDRFSESRLNNHPVRLLTIIRQVSEAKDDHIICFTVFISSRDKALLISTNEKPLFRTNCDWEPEGGKDSCVRIWCPDLLQEGRWQHIAVVLNRTVLKNSSVIIYINGQLVATNKLPYVSQNPLCRGSSMLPATSIYAFIGTPPVWRKCAKLRWKQASCHLVEDVFSGNVISTIYRLGPHYLGNLQAPTSHESDEAMSLHPLVLEEKIVFSLNGKSISQLTLAKIRKIYNRIDNKAIAKQLGMSSHENATMLHLLHNSAGHLLGTARTLGGIIIGYLGTRCFSPQPISRVVDYVGGCSILLGLVAMSTNTESLYVSVKALASIVKGNPIAQREMIRRQYYQMLAMLLANKKYLLNTQILQLISSLVCTTGTVHAACAIPNATSFQELLCDIQIWKGAGLSELERTLFELFKELLTDDGEFRNNLRIMREARLLAKLLPILPSVGSKSVRNLLLTIISILLSDQPPPDDLLTFGQFVVYFLPLSTSTDETHLKMKMKEEEEEEEEEEKGWLESSCSSQQEIHLNEDKQRENQLRERVRLRNSCLELIHKQLFTTEDNINITFCKELIHVLGFDWITLFAAPNVHPTTVIWSLRIIVAVTSVPTLLNKFREDFISGGWLGNVELTSQNKTGVILISDCNLNASRSPHIYRLSKEAHSELRNIRGFEHLGLLVAAHAMIPEIYVLLFAQVLGQCLGHSPPNHGKLNLDEMWLLFFKADISNIGRMSKSIKICPESISILLKLVRIVIHYKEDEFHNFDEKDEILRDYPITVIQSLFFLYQNVADFVPVFMAEDIIGALVGTLFPLDFDDEAGQGENGASALTNDRVRKFVVDFLRVILVDSFTLNQSSKAMVIDIVLEAAPEGACVSQTSEYQTEIMKTMMEHFIAVEISAAADQASMPVACGANAANIPYNICYFTVRLVDKLWQGMPCHAPEILEFVLKLIYQAKKKFSEFPSDYLYRCLNRTVLFLLSRQTDTVASQMPILETLHKITSHRNLVFATGNHDPEFIGCLTFCLFQLTKDLKIPLDINDKTTWHCNPQYTAESEELITLQGHNLMAIAAKRVWHEMYLSKKAEIEETFKITLSAMEEEGKTPDLMIVREMVIECSSRMWISYLDSEKKSNMKLRESQGQLQSKLQKVAGGLTRLASRTKLRKEESKYRMSAESASEYNSWVVHNVAAVKELVKLQWQQDDVNQACSKKYLLDEWNQIELELLRVRGIWGPSRHNRLDKWMLDVMEGPCRMRKRLCQNEMFYLHYPHRLELETLQSDKILKSKIPYCRDSKEYSRKRACRMSNLFNVERKFLPVGRESFVSKDEEAILPHSISNSSFKDDQDAIRQLNKVVKRTVSEGEDTVEEGECNDEANGPSFVDSQIIVRLLENREKISRMFKCARICGLDKIEGLLLFGKSNIYIVDGFTYLKSGEICDIESLQNEQYEPIIPNTGNNNSPVKRQYSKISYDDIREVHKRRYLLQPAALELFSQDGRNYLLAFARKIRNRIYHRILNFATSIADSAHQSVAGQRRTVSVEQGNGILSNIMGETSVTQRWVYLMHLNTLAGRSYNDLMQYPVFPWILADYKSDELNLKRSDTFRDFSMPMGAQTPHRLKEYKKRYEEWDDPMNDTPPYHYGTHYSSAMIVCSYLIRMEPFTQHFLTLQGGYFDLPDRLFHSIEEAWLSASEQNMADVKELIPEFFYLPEFLLNQNNFNLGYKQNGTHLNDVVLPKWAKGDAQEFVRMHREALECDYVSQHLNEWIDLIFGCKQQGDSAVKYINVFHHLFYEGNVDIYSIEDPLQKNAAIGFINNFGQIPKQLFKKCHPCKRLNIRTSVLDCANFNLTPYANNNKEKLFYLNLDNLKPSLQPIKELKGPVGQILQLDKSGCVLAVEQNKILMPPSFNKTVAWGFADYSLRICPYDTERATCVVENVTHICAEILACVCPSPKTIIMASSNTVVTVWSISACGKKFSLLENLYGHTEAVTCIAANTAYNIVVSGSRDMTAIIWDLSRCTFVRQLGEHDSFVSTVAINDTTGDIAICASAWLYLYSINGVELARVNTCVAKMDKMQQLLCVAFSTIREWDVENVIITGSSDGVVRMWSLNYVQINDDDVKNLPKGKGSVKNSIYESEPEVGIKCISEDGGVGDVAKNNSSSDKGMENYQVSVGSDGKEIKDVSADNDNIPPIPIVRRKRLEARQSTHSEKCKTSENAASGNDESHAILQLNENEDNDGHLKKGSKWQRQLIFRSKLTMHTAYDRKDNLEPASITAITVSRDHKTLFIGDARGRIFSWSINETPGRAVADHWLKDEGVDACHYCDVRFSLCERKHHCRNCGKVFCSKCSRYESEISRLKILQPVRVCQQCYLSLRSSEMINK